MWPLSLRATEAIKSAPRFEVLLSTWVGGAKIEDLAGQSGSVRYSSGTGTRAVLDVTVTETPGLWERLRPGAVELRATYRILFIDGTHEDVPLGRFFLTREAEGAGSGLLSLSAPDLWVRVVNARFEVPSTLQGPLVTVATRFVEAAIPDVVSSHLRRSSVYVSGQVFDRDRADAVTKLLESDGLEGFLDREGVFRTRDVPSLAGPATWFVRDDEQGVLVSADRERSVEQVRNVQVVNPAGATVWRPNRPVIAEDRNPASPTRVNGPMGRIPAFYASPLIRSREQAEIVARARLRRSTGMAASVGLSAITHPGLEPGDVFVVSVSGPGGAPGWVERHVVDTLTVPFDGTPQAITTRSSVAAESGDQEEGVVVA